MTKDLNILVTEAQAGSQHALEAVVRAVQDRIFHLALRILVNHDDALEASQEILILVVTKLSTFRGDSAFTTWVFRVATNYLFNAKKTAKKSQDLTFELFAADLNNGLVTNPPPPADDLVMLNELRITCTTAMLLCLDLNHRIAYVLGDIFEFEHIEAAQIMDISSANFRQKLSRARKKVIAFTSENCGIANSKAKCSCPARLPIAIAQGRINPENKIHAVRDAPTYNEVVRRVREVQGDLKVLHLQTATASAHCPSDLAARITAIVEGHMTPSAP